MAVAPPSRTLPWDTGRDTAVDLVRGVAVVCMVIAHVTIWVPETSGAVTLALGLINNVASPLFALIMGVSSGIVLTRRRHPVTGTTFVLRNLVRGLIVIAIGIALEQLYSLIAIVLMSLGATLVVAAPLALLPLPTLTGVAAVTFVVGPFVNAAARGALDPSRVTSRAWLDQVLQWLLLSPHYRMVSLLPFVLIGVVLARVGLQRRAALAALLTGVVAGVAVVALQLAGKGVGGPGHVSGSVPDALLDLTLAAGAFGVLVLLARWPAATPFVTALAPVRAVGALALTAYVLHVALIAFVLGTIAWPQIREDWLLLASGVLVGTVLACWLWWSLLGKGPIERLMALVTDPIGRADRDGVASFTAGDTAPDGRAPVPCHHGREHRSPHPSSRGDAPES
ncbi:DUF418 domain-containing protein [Janibacter sp. GS2]|uniref:DUF418 domain-containing protein n=1 Tax=Janibacter sp. GS2 TaxID=3442646 RepID=UPI003EBB5D9F